MKKRVYITSGFEIKIDHETQELLGEEQIVKITTSGYNLIRELRKKENEEDFKPDISSIENKIEKAINDCLSFSDKRIEKYVCDDLLPSIDHESIDAINKNIETYRKENDAHKIKIAHDNIISEQLKPLILSLPRLKNLYELSVNINSEIKVCIIDFNYKFKKVKLKIILLPDSVKAIINIQDINNSSDNICTNFNFQTQDQLNNFIYQYFKYFSSCFH